MKELQRIQREFGVLHEVSREFETMLDANAEDLVDGENNDEDWPEDWVDEKQDRLRTPVEMRRQVNNLL